MAITFTDFFATKIFAFENKNMHLYIYVHSLAPHSFAAQCNFKCFVCGLRIYLSSSLAYKLLQREPCVPVQLFIPIRMPRVYQLNKMCIYD